MTTVKCINCGDSIIINTADSSEYIKDAKGFVKHVVCPIEKEVVDDGTT